MQERPFEGWSGSMADRSELAVVLEAELSILRNHLRGIGQLSRDLRESLVCESKIACESKAAPCSSDSLMLIVKGNRLAKARRRSGVGKAERSTKLRDKHIAPANERLHGG
mmetsp:Transcript_24545/g.55879  ORF Transcript_24545/g.55879 Transcript_24545/m.55879 type:complete len:111 (+) Transcript_24545:228-560(+)